MTGRAEHDEVAAAYIGHAPGNYREHCAQCGKRPNDKTIGVTVEQDGGVWHCFRCDAAGSWRDDGQPYTRAGDTPVVAPKPERNITLASNWLALWHSLGPIDGVAKSYLQARGCELPPPDGDLRYADNLRHPSGYTGPALVALVTDTVTRAPITLHRTWIRANGTKAEVDPPRLLLGQHRKDGGVIRLWPDDAVTTGLGVAEGIETALTLATVYKPVWSLIDAGNMAKFPVLPGVESLLIAADHDAAGIRAAEQCAEGWYRDGREVRIAKSPVPGEDLNDFARRAA